MKDTKFLECLNKILDRRTAYKNQYPYNLGYFDGNVQSFDCWNLVKAIDWSNGTIADNWIVGNFAIYNPGASLGDWTGRQILNHCTEVSSDMSNIPVGAFLLYYDDSHAGVYMGNRKVCECTPAWGQSGVLLTDIGPNGERSFNGSQYGRWGWHGKLPFVEYTMKPEGQFHEGDIVTIVQGAKVYGTDIYFASWVYGTPLIITQITGDRVVVCGDEYVIGAVAMKDIRHYEEPEVEEPKPEPEPFHPGTNPKPEDPEPIPEPEDPEKEEVSILEKILDTLKAILDFLKSVFKKEKSDG